MYQTKVKLLIRYRPYGEIDRTDSTGPDIFRHKYTGQEESPKTGLYYYKSRYYDASIGRFTGADSVVMPGQDHGLNRYMYVNGNPVKFRDPGGNIPFGNFFRSASAAIKGVPHAMNNAIGGMAHSFNNFARGVAKSFNNASRIATRHANHLQRDYENNKSRYEQMDQALKSGITPENFLKMYFLARHMGKQSRHGTFPEWHRYTWDGNKDNFSKFFNAKSVETDKRFIVISYFLLKIPLNQIFGFLGALYSAPDLFRARPVSFVDTLAQHHDDHVGAGGTFGSPAGKTAGADGRMVYGIVLGWTNPANLTMTPFDYFVVAPVAGTFMAVSFVVNLIRAPIEDRN